VYSLLFYGESFSFTESVLSALGLICLMVLLAYIANYIEKGERGIKV